MNKISAWQFGLLVASSFMGIGIFQFPREAVDFAGPDAVYAFLLDSLGAVLLLMLFLWAAHRTPSLTQGRESIVRGITPAVTPLRILFNLLLAGAALANFGQIMRTFFLPGTPIWAIDAAMSLTVIYATWYGTPTMARSLETVLLPAIPISVLISLLVIPELHFSWAILPSTQIHLGPILAGTYHDAYIFMGLDATLLLFTQVRQSDKPHASRAGLRALIGAILFFSFGYLVVMGTTGPSALSTMQWPAPSVLRLANASGLIINKLGLLVVVVWGLFILAFLAVRLWSVGQDVAAWRPTHFMPSYRIGICAAGVLTMALSQIPANVVTLVHLFQTYGLPATITYMLLLPLLLGAMTFFMANRARRKRGAASSP